MQLDKQYKHITKIISKEADRPQLTSAYLDTEKKVLVATDGHRIVKVPIEVESSDKSGMIASAALIDAFKSSDKSANGIHMTTNGEVKLTDGRVYPRSDADFPPYEQVIPDFKAGDPGTVTLGFNAKYLLELAQALGTDKRNSVTVTIKVDTKMVDGKEVINPTAPLDPLVVKVGEHSGEAVGVLMPMRV